LRNRILRPIVISSLSEACADYYLNVSVLNFCREYKIAKLFVHGACEVSEQAKGCHKMSYMRQHGNTILNINVHVL